MIENAFPHFTLLTQDNKPLNLADYANGLAVLYFYPKDNTSGCTVEAQEFNIFVPLFKQKHCHIFGVSPDSVVSHQKFCMKYNLQFPLLVDDEKKLANYFGVWVEKSMYGRKYYGIERATFVFNNGQLVHEWRKVKAGGHAQEVYEFIQGLVNEAKI